MSARKATIFKCPKCGHKFGPGATEKAAAGPNMAVLGLIIVLLIVLVGLILAGAMGAL